MIAGASAGSMTGALVARAILNNPRHRAALHRAWVDDIDIVDLMKGTPATTLLSKEPILRIADQYLTLGGHAEDRPAPYAPPLLRMTFTLSNMNGVDYRLPFRHAQRDEFVSTFFSDRRQFRLTASDAQEPDVWARVKAAAIGSGSFPFAFTPAEVWTDDAMYLGHGMKALLDPFWFLDGGMFNNEPIREAVHLAREADGGALAADRCFLLVDPNLNESSHDSSIRGDIGLIPTAVRLLAMIRGESSANDWLRSQRLDAQIDWRDELVRELRAMIIRNELAEPAVFANQLGALGERIVDRKRRLFGADRYPPTYFADALERTRRDNRALLADMTEGRQSILASMIFLLNSISGLDKKSHLNISILYADREEVAGDPLSSFGGFFFREWREHDYRLGRRKAHELLPKIFGIESYEREPGVAYEAERDLSRATMADIPKPARLQAKELIVKKIERLIKQKVRGGLKGWAAWKFVRGEIESRIDADLALAK